MKNSSELNDERPLVTFALFAYNQEQYIREAIEGAFSQTYEPLEIILSDDKSSDRTFEIMQEMVAAYKGPHRVIARQSSENRGLLNHILDVAHESNGEYIVVAAGDDISRNYRTSLTILEMRKNNLDVLSACSLEISQNSNQVIGKRGAVTITQDIWLKNSPNILQIHGATAAYRRSFLVAIPLPIKKVFLEDTAFRILAFWMQKQVGVMNEPLILYRIDGNNIGPKGLRGKIKTYDHEKILCKYYERVSETLNYLKYCQKILNESKFKLIHEHPINDMGIEYALLRSNWLTSTFSQRVRLFQISSNFDSPRRDKLRSLGIHLYLIFLKIFEKARLL
ncbi:glycosyltransferase [Acinetobacter sp. YH12238]|uniref:glycosyltransferase n=1 Tax=Acinetobacter sp. YH12238 TaxID=2601165 RepID=UPI0015D16DE7|nr:glycosyltransferase [Acinetobacter sp. YH12238]